MQYERAVIQVLPNMLILIFRVTFPFQGENVLIESICQTIIDQSDILDILIDKDIQSGVKRPFLRFLLWNYLYTGHQPENVFNSLSQDE